MLNIYIETSIWIVHLYSIWQFICSCLYLNFCFRLYNLCRATNEPTKAAHTQISTPAFPHSTRGCRLASMFDY